MHFAPKMIANQGKLSIRDIYLRMEVSYSLAASWMIFQTYISSFVDTRLNKSFTSFFCCLSDHRTNVCIFLVTYVSKKRRKTNKKQREGKGKRRKLSFLICIKHYIL